MHDLDAICLADSPRPAASAVPPDARVGLIGASVTIVAVLASSRVWFPLAVAACCGVWIVLRRIRFKSILMRITPPLALVLVACALKALLTGVTPAMSWELGPWRLTATREGLFEAALLAARVSGAVAMAAVLCWQAPAQELLAALRWCGVPKTWVEIAALMCRYLFALGDQAETIYAAQRVRLGYAGLGRSFRSAGALAGVVLLRCLEQADRTHEAMLARGYNGRMPLVRLPPLRPAAWTMLATWTLAVVLAFLVLEGRWL